MVNSDQVDEILEPVELIDLLYGVVYKLYDGTSGKVSGFHVITCGYHSAWSACHADITRLKCILTFNDFPPSFIQRYMQKYVQPVRLSDKRKLSLLLYELSN